MQTNRSIPPDLQLLTRILSCILSENGSRMGQLTVVARKPELKGTFPKEVLTCRLDDGRELQLFCKYAAGLNHDAHGHRGGIGYELDVYRHVLSPMRVTAPSLYGVHTDKEAGEIWLLLEYIDGSIRVHKSEDPSAMGRAARWIAEFHAVNELRLRYAEIPFLKKYDSEYYLGWATRTAQYAENMSQNSPWLKRLCERFEIAVDCLLSAPPTVIHGEYYPKNILFRGGNIYPVDWESAAIAAGEIDLASLVEGWPEEVVRGCELQYHQARCATSSTDDFERSLLAARLYLQFRWLGERPDCTTGEMYRKRLECLHASGVRFGLI